MVQVQLVRTLLSLGLLASVSAQKEWKVIVGNETGAALFDPISLVRGLYNPNLLALTDLTERSCFGRHRRVSLQSQEPLGHPVKLC